MHTASVGPAAAHAAGPLSGWGQRLCRRQILDEADKPAVARCHPTANLAMMKTVEDAPGASLQAQTIVAKVRGLFAWASFPIFRRTIQRSPNGRARRTR